MVWKRFKKYLKREEKPHKPPEVEVKKQSSLQDDYDRTMMAISFAEAGVPEQALEIWHQRAQRKILVLGKEDTFSEAVIEYATYLAERLGYGLLALSVGATPSDNPLSPYQQHMQDEFHQRAAAAAAVLQQKAALRDIHCMHVVKFGDVSRAVEEVNREYRRVELVITDSQGKREELHARVNLPVFSLKTYG